MAGMDDDLPFRQVREGQDLLLVRLRERHDCDLPLWPCLTRW